ncbi:DNA repair protein REV1 isoform X2 [Orussus abietinus]|uniref:DNA repair protein REV1 isoform X2 n=1 Tax=Orussus abietinus TaxID=222816 RepID=UPI0006258F41|nr:DNA repair protein REV1 isoform X2 [Orussus abietinus]
MSRKKKSEAWGQNGFEDWGGYMAAKKAKLQEQFLEEANKEYEGASTLFNGVSIFVNGYTNPSADELKRLMMAHGGVYHHYERPGATTHLIASNLPYSKIVMYRKSKNPLPLCKPEWIVDSIKAGKILNYKNYLLYTHHTELQPVLNFNSTETKKTLASIPRLVNNVPDDACKIISSKKPSTVNGQSSHAVENSLNPSKNGECSDNSHCVKNPQFLTEFYNNSRLHHISTMGATFKDYINELRDKSDGTFPGLEKLLQLGCSKKIVLTNPLESDSDDDALDLPENDAKEEIQGQVIMHIDMDCFFVSVGIRNRPELKGLPVAVTHAKGNRQPQGKSTSNIESIDGEDEESYGSLSEVASCSYEAREAGIRNGMFLGQALKLCPQLRTIKYDFEGYKEVAYALYDTVTSYTLDIEAVSCDEMYADCTKVLVSTGLTPLEFGSMLREEIKTKTGCPVSTGFGGNKLQARLATKKAKPDGQFYLRKEKVQSYIGTLNVRDLPGVGATTTQKLNAIGVKNCEDLQKISMGSLQKDFGKKNGEVLFNMCRGIDVSKLNLEHVRKSVSAEVNYGIRFKGANDAEEFLKKLSQEVCTRLKKVNATGRCITLKLMVRAKEAPVETPKFMGHGLCYYFTRSKNLIASVDDVNIITKEVLGLWTHLQQVPEDIRGIGIQVSRLDMLRSKTNSSNLINFLNKGKVSHSENTFKIRHDDGNKKGTEEKNISKPKVHEETLVNYMDKGEGERAQSSKNQEGGSALTSILEEIDEAVLAELPEDIRNEILLAREAARPPSQASKEPAKKIQTSQEAYFKHTKPNSNKAKQVKLPPVEEIDMSVLVELPEDIRNEILNEYRAKKQESEGASSSEDKDSESSAQETEALARHSKVNELKKKEQKIDETNLSFSQVDPEFLAALSEDIRDDVKLYCHAKKRENATKLKNAEKKVIPTTNKTNDVWTLFKPDNKNTRQKPKIKGGPAKGAKALKKIKSGSVKTQVQTWISVSETVNEVDFLSLAEFLGILPRKRRIEDLHLLLKTMHRCVTRRGSCPWHRTYRKMVGHVQDSMRLEYKSELMVPNLRCEHRECLADEDLAL